jgi:Tol biopolymer transport system component
MSPDGKYVFASVWSPEVVSYLLYRINRDGSNVIPLIDSEKGIYVKDLVVSSSGFLFYTVAGTITGSRSSQIMRMPIAGGKAEKVRGLEESGEYSVPVISPNEKYLAYKLSIKIGASGEYKHFLRVVEISDGRAGKRVLEKEITDIPRLRWTPGSDAVVYDDENRNHNLFKIDLADGNETGFTESNQKTDIGDFLWSKDGKRILFFRISQLESLVLIKDAANSPG